MKILVADDEAGFAEILKDRLSIKGCIVEIALNGKQALDLIKSNLYDLVFLDHNMPELTGIELTKYIRENSLKTKIVIVTAYPEIEDFFAKALGADEYLTKPVKIKDVENIIDKYLSR
ncbi:MAG: response regulator [Candidatus Omnitrophica bacterium]|nr:response regulator [Candidatus Omnitrophota bacterium]